MKKILPLFPYLFGWGLLLATTSLFELSLINGISQLVLFLLVVCIPTWRTQRMSYVDIGWPWGLVVIGVLTLIYSDGNNLRVGIVGAIYIFMGLRMGIGALKLWRMGYLNQELPRYQYQHRRWDRAGYDDKRFVMQVEVLIQGLANAAYLAMPAFVIANNSSENISYFEIVGLLIWILAFLMESVSDVQKLGFLKSMRDQGLKNKVCNVGLWRYSRHPNYFAEWMVWNALLIASIPSWMLLQNDEYLVVWLLIGLSLLFVSRIMYVTLVHYTGAKPAEYYSVQKRPDYKQYQQTTNRFFPGRPKV
jgi:steroid 5-alpha reductase family enzyme